MVSGCGAGKNGAGKSSTANSLLNESAFVVAPFQQDLGKPVIVVKQHRNFIFRIIDTPGLVEGDQVNERVHAHPTCFGTTIRWLMLACIYAPSHSSRFCSSPEGLVASAAVKAQGHLAAPKLPIG